ncbi:MAG: hypothetical protein OEW19_04505, partial [Acidobacteriota bacterium]|nr:hypothetical protein [Acidobacteriota bacterium]
ELGPMREVCAIALEEEARALMNETVRRTQLTLRGLEALMGRLVTLQTPVNIVMISEGLFVARTRDDMSTLVRRAAEARATIHVIRPAQAFFDVQDRTSTNGPSRFYDDAMLSQGLEQLAGQTRGSMTTINATPAAAFDRLGRELSGYYLIGFEPTEVDRTGTERRIRVQVGPRGLTVRARPTFVIGNASGEAVAASAATLDPMEALKLALVSPLPERALPIRVASYMVTEAGSSKVRVVITAEVGEPASDEVEWPMGILVFDKDDEVVVSQAGPVRFAPASSHADSPRLLLTSVLLDPGDYTLRLAAVDTLGRAGSVHHPIHAGFASVAGGLSVSDLVLAAQPSGASGAPRPRPGNVVDSETLTAMIEMIGPNQTQIGQASVTIQVADPDTGAPLVSVAARPAARGDGRSAFAATLELGALPPGEYQARALLSLPGVPDTSIVRAFLLSPPRVPALDPSTDRSASVDPDAAPAPVATARILAPVPAFAAQTVLAPAVLEPFLDGLEVLHPPSTPEVTALIEQARHGIFGAPEIQGATPDDRASMAFIRGLQAYQKGDVARAAAWFRQTLRDAADFMGAAFYLGASHAANGRDSDAVGAWEMALLSENPGAVYPPLVDALLRLGESREAVEFLGEAPEAWASDDARLRREATAEAMLGAYDVALPKLQALLTTQKGDQNLLFLAIQVLYHLHAEGQGLTPSQQALFADYVTRHQDMGGPNTALVETWRKFVLP